VGMEKVHTIEEYILIKELKNAIEYILSIIKTVALGEKLDD